MPNLVTRWKSEATMATLGTVGSICFLSSIFPTRSYSGNGNVYATACACTTTAQFASAAGTAAGHYQAAGNGTYIVVSTSAPMTAYMKVIMELTQIDGTYFWIPQSETPINAAGASIAGQTESQLESNYGNLDVGLFGSRNNPLVVNEPSDYAESFINSSDEEVGPGIDQALLSIGINWSTLPVAYVITVKFSDGTTAQFLKDSSASTDHWIWTGVAHNSAGKPINRNGVATQNTNTAGTGAGTVDGNYNFGTLSPGFNINLGPSSFCTGSITIGDDELGYSTTTFIAPC